MSSRSVPTMTTDAEAEAFLDQDLSELGFTAFRPLDRNGRETGAAGARAGVGPSPGPGAGPAPPVNR